MSKYIAGAVHRGARGLVREADEMLQAALAEFGPAQKVAFPNTAYYLPTILGFMGHKVETLGDLSPVIAHCKELVHPDPGDRLWLPYLGETLDAGVATLLAAEAIEGIRFVRGLEPTPIDWGDYTYQATSSFTSPEFAGQTNKRLNGPIDDVQLRSWGIQLVDGRMPGFAAIVGCAKSNEVAVHIVRELQRRGILIFLSGNVNGRSIIHQLMEEGVQLGYDTFTVPFGLDTISAIYAIGFATRAALTFGGLKGGQAREILLYNKYRTFAFVLALGEVDDLKYAAAAGAISYGFPTIADTAIPPIYPTGVTLYEHVVPMPFDQIEGKDDLERAERLVQRCIEVRGVKIKITEVPIPVPYGSAFEGERVRREDMQVEFGGKKSRCFEYLRLRDMDEVEDHKIELIGPDIDAVPEGAAVDLGILVEVAGRKMQKDFEPILERQIHYFLNAASGVQHIGQRDIVWLRISKVAFEKGFRLKHFGEILYARLLDAFGTIVDKVQVTLITDPERMASLLEEARAAFQERNERLAGLTDEGVDTFYSCTLCQSFAPTHVCVVSPERLGLCGAYNWLDCRAAKEINPTGPNQPIPKGTCLDPVKGEFTGPNEFVYQHSQQTVERVTMYSIMDAPMTACLTEDAEVLVEGKLTRIGEAVRQWRETRLAASVLTLDEQGRLAASRLVRVHENPAPEKLVRLVTKSGLELVLTPNHEVAVDRWSSNGHTPWVRADQVQVEDRLYALKRLRLEGRVPALVDLLPDDVRVTDPDLLAEVEAALQARYGSTKQALQSLGLPLPDPRTHSMTLGTLRTVVESCGQTWEAFKQRVTHLAPPAGRPILALPPTTPDLFYLLGLLASDGSLDRRGRYQCRVNFTNTDLELLDAFAVTYHRLFPEAPLSRRQKAESGGTIAGRQIISTQPAFDLYGQNFLLGLLADGLGVRMAGEQTWDLSRLLSLPESHIAAFLAGLFDGDGHVRLRDHEGRWTVGEAYLSVHEERAARHLQMLLKRLGIVGDLRQDRAVWKIELHGSNLRRFAEVVPARHPAKRQVLDQILTLAPTDLDKTQEQVLPYAAGRALAALPESHTVLPPSTLFYYQTGRSRPVAGAIQQVIAEAPETAAVLAPWLDADYFLDTVVTAETVESAGRHEHVYNLSLLDINSYIANGIHVKNCGCFECIVMLIPEANGVMVVSREDPSMTPCGMTFSTLAGTAGGGLQTPGVMGVGKYYLTSKKFMSAEGGFKRVVWMSSFLKESMAEELKAVAEREGDPDLISKIADETICTDVEGLLPYLEEKGHPALTMDPIF